MRAETIALLNAASLPMSAETIALLNAARAAASATSCRAVSPEHVLLALLSEPQSITTKLLTEAGIDVEVGLLESEARALNAPYLKLLGAERPWIIAKWAMTLDGKIFSVVPRADPDARTFPVLVRARNPEGKIGSGMLARIDLTLGDVIHLLGFDLHQVQATPSTSLPLTLYWQADGATDIDYTGYSVPTPLSISAWISSLISNRQAFI